MKRRNFLTVALGMLLLPFVKIQKVKPVLTPWIPRLHPRQMEVFNKKHTLLISGGRQWGKTDAQRAGYWKIVPYQDIVRASQNSGGLRWKVMDGV